MPLTNQDRVDVRSINFASHIDPWRWVDDQGLSLPKFGNWSPEERETALWRKHELGIDPPADFYNVDCDACDHGTIECPTCHDTDSIKHEACDGKGCEDLDCSRGEVDCPTCDGGDRPVKCKKCKGSGVMAPPAIEQIPFGPMFDNTEWKRQDDEARATREAAAKAEAEAAERAAQVDALAEAVAKGTVPMGDALIAADVLMNGHGAAEKKDDATQIQAVYVADLIAYRRWTPAPFDPMAAAQLPNKGAPDGFWILDMSSWMRPIWHGAPMERSVKGEPRNVTHGVMSRLASLFETRLPGYVVAAFDPPGRTTFRDEMFDKYKARREPMTEEFRIQERRLIEIMKAHKIPVMLDDRFEADDQVATVARQASEAGCRVIVVGGDKDLHMLTTLPRTIIWTGNKRPVGPVEAKAIHRIDPSKLLDVFALAGDADDGVPGISGIGMKTAVELVEQFGSLEGVLKNGWQIHKKGVREKIAGGAKAAFLSRDLIRLADTGFVVDFAQARLGGFDVRALRDIYADLGMDQLGSRVEHIPKSAAW